MIIQSPELLEYKNFDAQKRIGRHFIALIAYKNGVAFGVRFNERQSKKEQWLMKINPLIMLGGIGDLRDFQLITTELLNFCQNMAGMMGEHYLTGDGIVKFLSGMLHWHFEEKARALAVNFLVADCRSEKGPFLWFIDFDGSIKQLKNFAVAGGSNYEENISEKELETLPEKLKKAFAAQKEKLAGEGIPPEMLAPMRIISPQKNAIKFLEEKWKTDMSREETIALIKKTIFDYDPDLKNKTAEITMFEYDKEVEALYVKKNGKE